jgi:hypothetical protein
VRVTGGALSRQGTSKVRIGPPSGGPILYSSTVDLLSIHRNPGTPYLFGIPNPGTPYLFGIPKSRCNVCYSGDATRISPAGLDGLPAGEKQYDGNYPEDTINYPVDKRLEETARCLKSSYADEKKEDKGQQAPASTCAG